MSWKDVPSAKPWGRHGLDPGARRIAASALEAILSDRRDGVLIAADAAWVERVLEDYDLSVGIAGRQVRIGLSALWRVLEWLPLSMGKLRPMSRLSLADRVAFLDAIEHHRVAAVTMIFIALKVPSTMSAFERGDPLRSTGFDRETAGARRRLPMEEAR